MSRNKFKKMLIILLILIFSFAIFCTEIFAKVNIDNINSSATVSGETEIKDMSKTLYSAITSIGVVISVVALATIGIKYMLGSAEERAEYKKSMLPYLIGAILVFSASTLASAVVKLAK